MRDALELVRVEAGKCVRKLFFFKLTRQFKTGQRELKRSNLPQCKKELIPIGSTPKSRSWN